MAHAPDINTKINAVLPGGSETPHVPNQDYRYLLDRKEPLDPDFHTHSEYFNVNHALLAHWHVQGREEHKHAQVVAYGPPLFPAPKD